MLTTTQAPLLELQAQVWKARAQAKQKWLERILAEPVKNPRDVERRKEWIDRALALVRQEQEDIHYRASLLDASAAHLSVLEMSLISATEQRVEESGASKRRES
jgi:hypothetical protein